MPRKLTRKKKLLFVGAILLGSLSVLLVLGELLARWRIEGGFWPALDSIVRMRTAAAPRPGQDLIADPDLGFRLNPASDGINSLGIPGPEIERTKPAGRRRILVLGDSISFPEDSWVYALAVALRRDHADRVEVINAACHGYTTYQQRVLLERDLAVLAPDVVIVQYCINDNWRFLHRLTSEGRRLLTPDAKTYLFPESHGVLGWLYRTSYLAYGVRRWIYARQTAPVAEFPWEDDAGVAPAWDDDTWIEQGAHFAAMAAKASAIGARLVVLGIPSQAQLDPVLLAKDEARTRKPQRLLGAICDRLDVLYLDLHDVMAGHPAATLFTDGLHLSAIGHDLVATEVVALLTREQLLPAR